MSSEEEVSKASTKSRTSKNGNGKRSDHSSTDLRADKTGKEVARASKQSRAGNHSPIPPEEGIQDTGPSLYSQLKLLVIERDRVPQWTRTFLEQRTPENVRKLWGHTLDRLQRRRVELIATILAIKALLFLFTAQTYQVLENKSVTGFYAWLEIWNRWDAQHYLELAQYGYRATGERNPAFIVFYPLFPWMVRLTALLFQDYLVSAIIISTLASIAAALTLQRLVQLDHSKEISKRAVWFLFIFPTSYFLHIGYTESLFLALVLGCFLSARTNRWPIAGILGALACLTRSNGLILIPALIFEAGQQYWTTRRWQWQWLWIAIVALGFGGYLLLMTHTTGDPFAFVPLTSKYYHRSLAWPWAGFNAMIGSMNNAPAQAEMVGVQELLFTLLGLSCTILCWLKLRPSYGVWMTLNWLLFVSANFVISTPRYVLAMFPIFVLFGRLSEQLFWNSILTVWSLLFLALFASQFVWGRWAF